MKYEVVFTSSYSSFFIFNSSLNFAQQNSFGRAASVSLRLPSRRAIRSITFAPSLRFGRYGGSATIPLAKKQKYGHYIPKIWLYSSFIATELLTSANKSLKFCCKLNENSSPMTNLSISSKCDFRAIL